MQEWWTGSPRGDRRRDDRVRDGDRQGRRPLRLPLQPAEEPRVVLAGDRPRRPRRRRRASASCSRAPTTCRRSRTSPSATRRRARRSPACSPRCSTHPVGARVRRLRVRALRAPRRAPARAEDGPHLPRARRRAPAGDAVLRGLPAAPARRGVARGRLRPLRRRRAPASCAAWSRPARRAGSGRRSRPTTRRRRSARSAAGSSQRSSTSSSRASSSCKPAEARQRYTLLARPDSERRARRAAARALRAARAGRDRADRGACSRSSRTTAARCGALVGYFGETRDRAVRALHPLPRPAAPSGFPSRSRNRRSRRASTPARSRRCAPRHPDALGRREAAGALPRAGSRARRRRRAKLTRDPLFGSLADRRFADVLGWCESAAA